MSVNARIITPKANTAVNYRIRFKVSSVDFSTRGDFYSYVSALNDYVSKALSGTHRKSSSPDPDAQKITHHFHRYGTSILNPLQSITIHVAPDRSNQGTLTLDVLIKGRPNHEFMRIVEQLNTTYFGVDSLEVPLKSSYSSNHHPLPHVSLQFL